MRVIVLLVCAVVCHGQNVPINNADNLHRGLTERIGNFSIELLYHTASLQKNGENFIMSPITLWTALAIISEGAVGNTRYEINNAIRVSSKQIDKTRSGLQSMFQWLRVNTSTVELAKINTIFVDQNRLPLQDFQDISKKYYDTELVPLDFKDNVNAANLLNRVVSNITHGRIPKIVESSTFENAQMVLTSAVYFKGQWTMPFNSSSTSKMPFYNSNGEKIGEVNMMYNRHTYPFSNIKLLQARVIELPYGKENRLSMIIMLPYPGVSLETMFANFQKLTLDAFFENLRISKEDFGDDEIDCYIPRFKITSNLDMSEVLQDRMGIKDMFDQQKSRLPLMARMPMYISRVIHKAEIEVTEEGTTASAVTVAEISNRIGAIRFEANRPFTYMIVEKVTNSIVFGGFYKQPSVY